MMQNDSGATQERLTRLAEELGLVDWREWVGESGFEAVLSGVTGLDLDTLPFMGEG